MDPAAAIEALALSRMKVVNEAITHGDSEIQRFYKNSVIFLTGGSGFLGKQLVEKLFRSCIISKMYLLIRPKKGKHIQQRLDDLFNEPVFDALREVQPDFTTKIVPVVGDVSEIRLGINDGDWRTLTEEVNVIFHAAATTRFDETIRVATLINVRGTREVLALGKSCKNLKSYVHVSTAYTHATSLTIGKEVPEDFSESPVPPNTLISMAESMKQERLIDITAGMIKNWPNTYTFTKAVAEELVRETSVGLPICIVRPGVVICSYSEPSPGWIDVSCIYGASGYLFGLGLGLVHTIHVNLSISLGMVPCDMVNNAIIAAGRETATSQSKGGNNTRIYAVSTTFRNSFTWSQFEDTLLKVGPSLATPAAVYYAFAHDTSSRLVYLLLTLFLHIIPAYIADFVCLLIGKERRFVKIAKKLYNMMEVLSYFMLNEWKFVDKNLTRLYNGLSKQDKAIFNFDISSIDFEENLKLWCIGIRKYIVKDGLKDTTYGVRLQKILRVVHYVLMALYLYGLWKLCCFAYYVAGSLFTTAINVF